MRLQDNVVAQISNVFDNTNLNDSEMFQQNNFSGAENNPQMPNSWNNAVNYELSNAQLPSKTGRAQSMDSFYFDNQPYQNSHYNQPYQNAYHQKPFYSYENDSRLNSYENEQQMIDNDKQYQDT